METWFRERVELHLRPAGDISRPQCPPCWFLTEVTYLSCFCCIYVEANFIKKRILVLLFCFVFVLTPLLRTKARTYSTSWSLVDQPLAFPG